MKVNTAALAGAACLLIAGLTGVWFGTVYGIGSATRMGPGFFPAAAGGILALIAILILILEVRGPEPEHTPFPWRPTLAVLGSAIAFMVGIAYFGLIPAIALTIIVSSFGDRQSNWPGVLVLAVLVPAFMGVVFIWGLNLPIPLFKAPF
ncbi:hypothetical protein ATO6_03055 [Oceanicola sp. 22II-s10i]|uniref:tripartite tricarboxylate transporter TctB family protein n=1 Tax=Oceanicola sp. 22II-s10i TaxID=1317116 RepID=UPI000B5239B7|nr:tripartite tricarboxylate transporter TctB family protein [Oceanicola sp. 22II-s10i]OWU85883.1 hypothetical protein ATO6_03055 [Oceanicola sp. 22II-s10i]